MTKSKIEQALELTKQVEGDETPTKVTMTATIVVDNPFGKTTTEIAAEFHALLPIAEWRVYAERPATLEEQLAFLSSGNPFGHPPMCNGHELQRLVNYIDVPCWRIANLERIKEAIKDDPEAIAQWATVSNSDNPNGLIHDETCTSCKGKGTQKHDETIGWHCRYCNDEHVEVTGFYTSSCLLPHGVTKDMIDEWREEHEFGEHTLRRPGCPLCAADNMRRKAEKANA